MPYLDVRKGRREVLQHARVYEMWPEAPSQRLYRVVAVDTQAGWVEEMGGGPGERWVRRREGSFFVIDGRTGVPWPE